MKKLNFILLVCLAIVFIHCEKNGAEKNESLGPVTTSDNQKFQVDTLAKGFLNPWGLAFLPDGRILITERKGEIRIFENGKLSDDTIQHVPAVYANGQGGLLDIQLHPDYANNGWIYLSYAKPVEGGGATTIARAKLNGNTLTDLQEIFVAQPYINSGLHFGSRIVFDGEGHIFFSCGERGTKENAQTLEHHLGKIIRLNEDGSVPSDNPFVNTPNAKPEIWSYGHRNPQGLYYDKVNKNLWEVEHGPKGGDELNRVEKGKNYGWPVITYGIDYSGEPISDITAKEGMEQPVYYWVPSIATCGMTMVTGDKYPGWKNDILVGGLVLTQVARVDLDNEWKSVKYEKLMDKVGRVRLVTQSPDGFLYVLTESPGLLLKIIPAQ
jgi:glucose/arabinose dehydrogenase